MHVTLTMLCKLRFMTIERGMTVPARHINHWPRKRHSWNNSLTYRTCEYALPCGVWIWYASRSYHTDGNSLTVWIGYHGNHTGESPSLFVNVWFIFTFEFCILHWRKEHGGTGRWLSAPVIGLLWSGMFINLIGQRLYYIAYAYTYVRLFIFPAYYCAACVCYIALPWLWWYCEV